jgi:hypothetical protein
MTTRYKLKLIVDYFVLFASLFTFEAKKKKTEVERQQQFGTYQSSRTEHKMQI